MLQHMVLFTPQSTIKGPNRSFTKHPAAGLAKYHHLCSWRVVLKWGRAHCYAHSLLHSSLFLVCGWRGTTQHVLTAKKRPQPPFSQEVQIKTGKQPLPLCLITNNSIVHSWKVSVEIESAFYVFGPSLSINSPGHNPQKLYLSKFPT